MDPVFADLDDLPEQFYRESIKPLYDPYELRQEFYDVYVQNELFYRGLVHKMANKILFQDHVIKKLKDTIEVLVKQR